MEVVNEEYPVGRNPNYPHDAKPGARPIEPVRKEQINVVVQAQVSDEIMAQLGKVMKTVPTVQDLEEQGRLDYAEPLQMTLKEVETAFMEGWVDGANKRLAAIQAEKERAALEAQVQQNDLAEKEIRLANMYGFNSLQAEKEKIAAMQAAEREAAKVHSFTDRYGVTTHPSGLRTKNEAGWIKSMPENAPNSQGIGPDGEVFMKGTVRNMDIKWKSSPRDQMAVIFEQGRNLFYLKNEEYGNSIELTGLVGALAAMTGDVGAARKLVFESLGSGTTADWNAKVRNKLIDAMVQAAIAILMLDNDNIIGKGG